jgi:uncharacterized membrane protein
MLILKEQEKMENLKNVSQKIRRIKGQLYEILIIKDDQGKEVQRINVPLKVELRIHDILEILVGASILAVPVAFTEEVWNMGDELAWLNVILLSGIALLFLGAFIYFTSYRAHLKMFRNEFLKRTFTTFLLSVIVVGLLLTVVDKCPWVTDFNLALKRTLIGAFPASLSATLTDNISS